MRNVITLFFALILLGSCSTNQSILNSEINVVEVNYGICDMEVVSSSLADTPTGKHGVSKNFEIFKKTKNIPCVTGQSFGVSYVLSSNDNRKVPVQVKWIFPETITNDQGEQYASMDFSEVINTNEVRHNTYTLGEKYLEVKGDWKFELYSHGEKLYEKKFRLN